jgi:hypothetical protein
MHFVTPPSATRIALVTRSTASHRACTQCISPRGASFTTPFREYSSRRISAHDLHLVADRGFCRHRPRPLRVENVKKQSPLLSTQRAPDAARITRRVVVSARENHAINSLKLRLFIPGGVSYMGCLGCPKERLSGGPRRVGIAQGVAARRRRRPGSTHSAERLCTCVGGHFEGFAVKNASNRYVRSLAIVNGVRGIVRHYDAFVVGSACRDEENGAEGSV